VLAAFLGAPAALAACRSHEPPPFPEGEIKGASDGIGHRLRAGLRIEAASIRWSSARVVIVGGGIAGLSAAWRMLLAGFDDFVLLELEPAPGGTSRSGSHSSAPVPYPWGAHYLPAPARDNRALIRLLDEMGVIEGFDESGEAVIGEQFLCRDPEERIFYKGRWYEGLYLHAGASPADLAQLERFNAEINNWVGWRDGRGRRAFTIPVASCSDDEEATRLDRIWTASLWANGCGSAGLIPGGCAGWSITVVAMITA
jgi:glycine/D-amino acid oxidase-like deaminating enzyme